LLDAIGRVAGKDVTVLVRGETGTGKELIASLIHAESKRAKGPLVRFNCAAIPGELAEAELFGHARGAFTGAQQQRRGFFAQAHGGTLVLDEVGELSTGVQAKVLRAIQEGEIQPVGSGRIEKVDVRIVACTNRDLEAEARAGRFREDLYYRLAVVELVAPPLRDRPEDVPALAREFARHYGDKFGVGEVQLTEALVRELVRADWPGNVRQLENLVARMIALSPGGPLDLDALAGRPPESSARPGDVAADAGLPLKEQVEAFERGLIARALEQSQGNQSEAARILGMSRPTLIDKIKKYGLGNAGG
jgi:two-component system response regulator AtoC